MSQLNLNITPKFLKDITLYMKKKKLTKKSDAIRIAIQEALENISATHETYSYHLWLGAGLKVPLKSKPKFLSEDELW